MSREKGAYDDFKGGKYKYIKLQVDNEFEIK